ncbi:hypothetical protein WJX84_008658 [Apatococcus fuscideae]|uniref:Uncharacterized protein n=1 Tax=Apatococcus fuscideae TaxID=2026836 RepID=A0AAW1SNA9_9CHLO
MALAGRLSSGKSSILGLCRQVAPSVGLRSASTDSFTKRERGEETAHFKREEARMLKELLNKVKKSADEGDSEGAAAHKKADTEALKKIVGKYNMSETDLDAVVAWKYA